MKRDKSDKFSMAQRNTASLRQNNLTMPYGQSIDPRVLPVQLIAHHTKNAVRNLRHFHLLIGTVLSGEPGHSLNVGWQDMSKLPENASDHVYVLGTLSNDQISSSMNGKYCLLVLGLDLDRQRGRPTNRFTNRLGIRCVRLASLHVSFDIGSRHEPNIMPKLTQLGPQ